MSLWWLDQMVGQEHPFVERMTWFWHGHWTTSYSKVYEPLLMFDHMRSAEIAERLDWEKSRLSHQVSRMEERGLVARCVCPVDARSSIISLTPSGRKYIRRALPDHFENVKHCFTDLLTSAQLDALIEISEVGNKHLAEARQGGSTS
jgi:DNA-binding MarR family transcriptional regulator